MKHNNEAKVIVSDVIFQEGMIVELKYHGTTELREGQKLISRQSGLVWQIAKKVVFDPFDNQKECLKRFSREMQGFYLYQLNPYGHNVLVKKDEELEVCVPLPSSSDSFERAINAWRRRDMEACEKLISAEFLECEKNFRAWSVGLDEAFAKSQWNCMTSLITLIWGFVPYYRNSTEEGITVKLCSIFNMIVDLYETDKQIRDDLSWLTYSISDYFFHKTSTADFLTEEFYLSCKSVFTWEIPNDISYEMMTIIKCKEVVAYSPNKHMEELMLILSDHPNSKIH